MGLCRGYIGARLEFEGFREDSKEQFPFSLLTLNPKPLTPKP